MIINSSNRSGSIPSRDDLFNKNKLADEAKKVAEQAILTRKDQEKRKLQVQIDNRKRELTPLESKLRLAEQHLGLSTKDRDSLEREIFRLDQQVKQLEGGKKYLNDTASVHEEKKQEALIKTGTVSQKISKTDNDLKELEKEKQEATLEINDLTNKIKDLEQELVRIKSLFDQKRKKLDDKQREITSLQEAKRKLDQETKSVEQKVQTVISEHRSLDNKITEKEDEIKKVKSAVIQAKKNLEQVSFGIKSTERAIDDIKKEIEEKKRDISNLERQRDAIR